MSDFSIERANRAAAGIRETVNVPQGRPAAQKKRVKVYAGATADVLSTLAKLHDAKHRAAAPAAGSGRGGVVLNPNLLAHPPRVTVDPHILQRPVLIRRPLGGDPAVALGDEHIMTASILGQFMIENTAGRTAIAEAIVGFVKSTGARHGMDGLLLTSLLHLEAVHDAAFQDGLKVWRNTLPSAGSVEDGDSGVVFTSQGQGLTSIPTATFKDPFAGGVCLPAVVQHYQQLHGRDVMIGAVAVVVIYGLVGGARGALDAYGKGGGAADVAKGFVGGAIDGVISGLKEVGGFIGKLLGWATQDDAKDTDEKDLNDNPGKDSIDISNPNPGGKGEAPTDKDTQEQVDNKDKKNADVSNPNQGGGTSGGDNTGGTDPNNEVPPPDNHGFPDPDGDGGGSPWSLVATSALLTVSSAKALIQASPGTVFGVAQLPGVSVLQNAFNAQSPLLTQVGSIVARQVSVDQSRIASLKTMSQTIAAQIGANAHIGGAAGIGAQKTVGPQGGFIQR